MSSQRSNLTKDGTNSAFWSFIFGGIGL